MSGKLLLSVALLLATAIAAPAPAPAPALAAHDRAVRYRIEQRGRLPGTALRTIAVARLAVRSDLRRKSTTSRATLRLLEGDPSSCRYDVTITTRVVLAPAEQTAVQRVVAALPATGDYVLGGGSRGSAAWRVTRRVGITDLRLDALRVSPATVDGVLPGGQRAYQEIRIDAASRRGDDCHAGSYRTNVGPALDEILAGARTSGRASASR